MNRIRFFTFVLAWAGSAFSGVVIDGAMGYSITLPENWAQLKTKETQHHFKDGSGQYQSHLSIVRFPIDKASYPSPRDWTEAHFIAYKLAVETSVFPFGAVIYFDSSAARTLGEDWAPEAMSMLFPGDGTPTYSEYIRYCARGDFGYEIYAIGDSTDMMAHVDLYAGIIATATLTGTAQSSIRIRTARQASALEPNIPAWLFDVRGRLIGPAPESPGRRAASGIRFLQPSEGR